MTIGITNSLNGVATISATSVSLGHNTLVSKTCSCGNNAFVKGQIIVEGAEGNRVTLFDINGRALATKQDYATAIRFDAPASGTYMIKIGNHAAKRVVVVR